MESNGEELSTHTQKPLGSQIIILGGIKKMQAISSKHVEQKIFILQETEDEFWKLVNIFVAKIFRMSQRECILINLWTKLGEVLMLEI